MSDAGSDKKNLVLVVVGLAMTVGAAAFVYLTVFPKEPDVPTYGPSNTELSQLQEKARWKKESCDARDRSQQTEAAKICWAEYSELTEMLSDPDLTVRKPEIVAGAPPLAVAANVPSPPSAAAVD